MGFRAGLAIGALAAAVVALGVAVIVLATDDDGSDRSATTQPAVPSSTATIESGATPCRVEHAGGEARIEVSASGLTCEEATRIYTEYEAQVEAGNATDTELTEQIEGWQCKTHPLAEYPLLVRCQAGEQRIDVLGLAPSAHEELPFVPPSAGPVSCGTIGGSLGNNVFDLRGVGVDCDLVHEVTNQWLDAGCGAEPEGTPCTVPAGFTCVLRSVEFEVSAITCTVGDQVVRFSTGA